jgi:uncharacterized protein YoxC
MRRSPGVCVIELPSEGRVSDTPIDCIIVGLAILVFSIMLSRCGASIVCDQRLAHMETSLVGLGQQMTAALHAIERFLDRQDQRDAAEGLQSETCDALRRSSILW